MAVQCDTCGQEWEQDPARQVACPRCPADVGQPCRRPSGHPAGLHAARDKKALREVEGYGRCPATPDGDIEAVEKTVTTQQTRLEDLAGGEAS